MFPEFLDMLALLVFLVVLLFSMRWQRFRLQRILKHWTQTNGYEILSSEYRLFRHGPFSWTISNGQPVYFVTIWTAEGTIRRGWVRCGSFLWGTYANVATVRWEE